MFGISSETIPCHNALEKASSLLPTPQTHLFQHITLLIFFLLFLVSLSVLCFSWMLIFFSSRQVSSLEYCPTVLLCSAFHSCVFRGQTWSVRGDRIPQTQAVDSYGSQRPFSIRLPSFQHSDHQQMNEGSKVFKSSQPGCFRTVSYCVLLYIFLLIKWSFHFFFCDLSFTQSPRFNYWFVSYLPVHCTLACRFRC